MAKRISQAVLVKALRKAGGIPAGAAQILDCARSTVTRRIEKSPELKALIEELQEELVDVAEYGIAKAVRSEKHKKHFEACKFVCETKGKARGWTKQIGVEIAKAVPITFTAGQEALG